RAGDSARESVGIDVERPAIGRGCHRCQYRDHLAPDHLIEHGQVDFFRLTDETEVDDLFDIGIWIDNRPADLTCLDHVPALAADPPRPPAARVDVAANVLVARAGRQHFPGVGGFGAVKAQACRESRFEADLLEHGLDLRATAVNHHRIDCGLFKQDDVA